MARRSALFVLALLTVLTLLAPVAAIADPCPDCGGSSQGCCPSQGCSCCLAVCSILTAGVRAHPVLAPAGLAGEPSADRCLSADSADVFHVPKPSLP